MLFARAFPRSATFMVRVAQQQFITPAVTTFACQSITPKTTIAPKKRLLTFCSRYFTTTPAVITDNEPTRLSKLLAQSNKFKISRREAERLIKHGMVTIAGQVVTSPFIMVTPSEVANSIKVQGKLLQPQTAHEARPRVWIVHKLIGEVISEQDPQGRPSLLERLMRAGVGKNLHLKAVGRLDMSTEGLILVTNDGGYKREMELPSNRLHRTYRVRVHGKLAPYKLKAMRQGLTIENIHYRGMMVQIESRKTEGTNTWLKLTCVEGKNRQIRKVLNHLGLNVTRLIRIAYGDYDLQTIPPGMAMEIPIKPLDLHKRRGNLVTTTTNNSKSKPKALSPSAKEEKSTPVQWVRHS